MSRPTRRIIDIIREDQDLQRRHRGQKPVDPGDIVTVIPDGTSPQAVFRVVETTLLLWQGQTVRMNAGSTFRVCDYGLPTVQVWVHARLLKVARESPATESPREGLEGAGVGVTPSQDVGHQEDGEGQSEGPIPADTSAPAREPEAEPESETVPKAPARSKGAKRRR